MLLPRLVKRSVCGNPDAYATRVSNAVTVGVNDFLT